MGKAWDGGDVAFRPETWTAVLRVLKPGAHLLAFGGTRTFHRLMCAIEDAGFEIRDTLMWVHGEGFPKSKNQHGDWEGWGTALKPAWEPIIMARKPFAGTVEQNLAANGCGGLNVDACRVLADDEVSTRGAGGLMSHVSSGKPYPRGRNGEASADRSYADSGATDFSAKPGPRNGSEKGRWPANLIHDGSDEVVRLFPSEAGAIAPVTRRGSNKFANTYGEFAGQEECGATFQGDRGSAARFFYCAKASRTDRNDGLQGRERKAVNWSSGDQSPGTFQSPNTDRQQENHHPTVKPTELMRWLVRLVCPRGSLVVDPFMGSGSTGKAAAMEQVNFIGIDHDAEYCEIARARINADAPLFAELA